MVKGDEDDNFQAVNELEDNDNIEVKQDEASEQPRSHDKLSRGSQAKRGNSWGFGGLGEFFAIQAPRLASLSKLSDLSLKQT